MAENKWQKLHDIFYANMNVAMFDWLAEQLGVQASALRDLQIGWCPRVQFKSGKYGYGYFTIPQRDSTGKITGLALRDREGGKIMYPGPTPGCVFHVNPRHRKGDLGYSAGAHNWVRTMDAKEVCPVCGKPDGCLLSAENPAQPKAVICRVTPSDKKQKFGWLHIRKTEGDLSAESLLAGEGTVVVVEGMSDVAAAASIGLTGIGRPSNLSGLDIAAELVRGRPVVVVGENDLKPDGKWPGREGMVAAFQSVCKKTFSVKMVLPPSGVKDLRAWIVTNGLTRDQFDEYVEKHGIEKVDNVLPNAHPTTVAKACVEDTHYVNKRHLMRRWRDSWYLYNQGQGRYLTMPDCDVRSEFYRWSIGKQFIEASAKGEVPKDLVATSAMWTSVHQATEAIVGVQDVDSLPAWINGAKGTEAKDLIVFTNGILDITEPDHDLLPTTPDFFNTTALLIPFNPAATCPTWLSFLQSSLGDETAKIGLLQEWFGYCLTPDTSRQKMMYMRGESGSGKGTILNVLMNLVGPAQHASSSLSQLAEQFGLAPLIGKLVCVIGDARLSRNTDAMRGLEVLLGITGNDAMQINRKFKDQLEGTFLTARITIASNDFLDVPDHSGAMLRRLNVIQFSRSFKENPDITLPARLAEETEGIAVWSLAGLRRLRERGSFTVPESSRAALQEWERDTNPLVSWLEDCTERRGVISKDELFGCWSGWASDTRRATWTRSMFLRRLFSNCPQLEDAGINVKGITINQHAGRRYLGKP